MVSTWPFSRGSRVGKRLRMDPEFGLGLSGCGLRFLRTDGSFFEGGLCKGLSCGGFGCENR